MNRRMRPALNIELTQGDKFLDNLSIVLLLGIWALILKYYSDLPAVIPVHYNVAGEADAFGPRWFILILPTVSTLIYGGLTWLNRNPHRFNYPVKITEENAPRQYMLAMRMIRGVKLAVLLVLGYGTFRMLNGAMGKVEGLGAWFVPLSIGFIFLPILLYIMKVGVRQPS